MVPVPAPQKSGGPKALAFVALIGLDETSSNMLRDSFKQFGIETAAFKQEDAAVRFKKEKYEACVVHLDSGIDKLLAKIRNSPNTQRMVIYGICATAQEALKFSQYGINATFNDPLDRQNLLRVIRATHLLVLHELRRYVRIPMVTEVTIKADHQLYRATMIEVSGGGLSMQIKAPLKIGDMVDVSFSLPNHKELSLHSVVAWMRPDFGTGGVRYDPMDPNRVEVKDWIDDYLDIE
jgi:Tfp pilus assembly protein PilZ